MDNHVYLSLVIHNHQPLGNFDGVIEQAYQDSYLPFLEVFEAFEFLRIGLHTSGPLMLWLEQHHPEYLDRVRILVAAGRIEIIGGPFYEPILTMIPDRDRRNQVARYRQWLESTFDTEVLGAWTPERVWESQLVGDLAAAGAQYTILDDYHFQSAGLSPDDLLGYYVTEDNSWLLRVFPGSEKLRYWIPFASVEETVEHARQLSRTNPGAVLVLGDDGEKFGTWPGTREHVYTNGWLQRFFQSLTDNRDWLRTATPAEIISSQAPKGSIYLPESSYREMSEWSLPVNRQVQYDAMINQLESSAHWDSIRPFIRGGNWRNFRVKYSEANEMYARMMEVSQQLGTLRAQGEDSEWLAQAEDHLYRSQCNCPYWHGAFGGIYLPHLRNANYRELIAAENLVEEHSDRAAAWVDASMADFNFDLFNEVKLANDSFVAYVAPNQGGMIYELDVRSTTQNLLATMQRRHESYHAKIVSQGTPEACDVNSIHDRVTCKQNDLGEHIRYDSHPRKSLLDHFWDPKTSFDEVMRGSHVELGDFLTNGFGAKLRRASQKIQLLLNRDGLVSGDSVRLSKAINMEAGSASLRIIYLIEGLPPGRPYLFSSEWNFAGLPSKADDRFFYDDDNRRMGHLGSLIESKQSRFLGLQDQWQEIDIQFQFNRPTNIWAFPIETISQSEAGIELVHQSVCVMPHWMVQGDVEGVWSVEFELSIRGMFGDGNAVDSHMTSRQMAR